MDLTTILTGSSVVAGLAVVGGILSCYKRCPNDQMLVKYGLGGNKVITDKGAFIVPFFQDFKRLSLNPMNIDISLNAQSNVVSKDKIRVVVEADATFAISSSAEERKVAATRLLSFSRDQISALATEILTGQTRTILSEMDFQELLQDRASLMEKVSANAENELSKLGLDLINFNIKMIKDQDGITEMLGKKASALATSDAQIAVAEQDKKADIGVAETQTARDIAVADTTKKREIQIAQNNAEIAEEKSKSMINQTKAEQNRIAEQATATESSRESQESSKINADKAIELSQLDRAKTVQMKQQAVAQDLADAEKITTIKRAEVNLEQQRATEVVATKVEAEKQLVITTNNLSILKMNADNELSIAKTKADAVKIEADAYAYKMSKQAEADAMMVALPIREKAKAEKELKDVYGQDGIITLKLLEILPLLAKAQAEAVSGIKIDSFNIISGGGTEEGGAGSQIGGIVSDITRSIPAFKIANDLAESINMPKLKITQ